MRLSCIIKKLEEIGAIDEYMLHRSYDTGDLELNICFHNDKADKILKESGIEEIQSCAFWE